MDLVAIPGTPAGEANTDDAGDAKAEEGDYSGGAHRSHDDGDELEQGQRR